MRKIRQRIIKGAIVITLISKASPAKSTVQKNVGMLFSNVMEYLFSQLDFSQSSCLAFFVGNKQSNLL